MSITKRIAVGLSAVTLAVGGGFAVSQASDSSVASGTQTAQSGAPSGGGPDVSALANDLGVSTTALQKAMQKAMPQPGTSGSSSSKPTDMAATLATALNLSQSKVAAALKANQPSGSAAPPSGSPPSSAADSSTSSS